MSAYDSDDRVQLQDDGTATLPDETDGDLTVRPDGGGFVVYRAKDDSYLWSDHAWAAARQLVPQRFPTLDEAIRALIGDPR